MTRLCKHLYLYHVVSLYFLHIGVYSQDTDVCKFYYSIATMTTNSMRLLFTKFLLSYHFIIVEEMLIGVQ